MSDNAPNNVSSINSGSPFKFAARAYIKKGWAPLPLPKRDKFPPPTGWTGRTAPVADYEQVEEWLSEGHGEGNIGLRLYDVSDPSGDPLMIPDPRFSDSGSGSNSFSGSNSVPGSDSFSEVLCPATVIGVDVDNYEDDKGNRKNGGRTLQELEKRLGPLPDTWISSAREDGVSGLRMFLVPADLSYKGKAGESIDIVQRVHRFAVVYPSWHPKGGQYMWYRPGQAPTGAANSALARAGAGAPISEVLPKASELSRLPLAWVEELSQGFMEASSVDIDMDMSVDEIYKWARKTFKQKGGSRKASAEAASEELEAIGCSLMKKRTAAILKEVAESDDSHSVVLAAHWNLLLMGLEGHSGWMSAVRVVENAFVSETASRGKRGLEEVRGELFRSRTNALRKIKAKADTAAEDGVPITGRTCGCYEEPEGFAEDLWGKLASEDISRVRDPCEYEMNDYGNASHFSDLLPEAFYFVEGYEKWLAWDGSEWAWDKGHSSRAFRKVIERQKNHGQALVAKSLSMPDAPDGPESKRTAKLGGAWMNFAKDNGNVVKPRRMLDSLKDMDGLRLASDVPDGNPWLLGVANGVLEFSMDGVFLRENRKEDMVIARSPFPFIPLDEQAKRGGNLADDLGLWLWAVEKTHPNKVHAAWLQQVMGMTLVGLNVKKKMVFLYGEKNTGKSTFLNTLSRALGPAYATTASMNIFDGRTLNPQLGNALSKRIVIIPEAGGKQNAATEMLKRITGNDEVNAEYKNSNEAVIRVASFTPLFSANTSPEFDTYDEALQDRILVVPFSVPQRKSEKGAQIEERCQLAALAWMVEGWRLFCANQLGNEPEEFAVIRKEFDSKVTPIGSFLSECVEITDDDNDFEHPKAMYEAYTKWCDRQNEKPWSGRKFALELSQAGHPTKFRRIKSVETGENGEKKNVSHGAKVHPGVKLRRNDLRFRVEKA